MASRFAFARIRNVGLDSEAAVTRHAVVIPALLAACMIVVGYSIATVAGVDGTQLIWPYLKAGMSISIVCIIFYVFQSFARLALKLAENPVDRVLADLRAKAPMFLLPAVVFPLFLCGFTTAKTSIPFIVGYRWDAFWADIDLFIFGDDAWRFTHDILGFQYVHLWEWFYGTVWGTVLVLYKANVPIYASARRAGIIYTSMLLTWFVGGWFMAYAMSAAGPIFAHLADASLAERFAPMRAALDANLHPESSIKWTQSYLAQAINLPISSKGGGISAFPSMHMGAVSIYVLSARGTRWLIPAIALWVMTFIGSAYFGYHYWIDGIVAALVAWGAWKVAEACFQDEQPIGPGDRRGRRAFTAIVKLPELLRPTHIGVRILKRDSESTQR